MDLDKTTPAPATDPLRLRVVGEAIVDLVGVAGEATYLAHPGGSPANVAVDLARLEVPVSFHGRLSGDTFGRMLRAHLAGHRVDLSAAVAAAEPSTLAVASVDQAGGATYDFWTTGTADWQWRAAELPDPLPAGTAALHTGSLAAWLAPSAAAVADLLAREHARAEVTLSLDPNCRPDLMGEPAAARAWIERLVSLVDVVKVSQEDLAWLLPGQPAEEVAARWLAAGPALVVITHGGDGAYGLNRAGAVSMPAVPVEVVDTIGAGDAFTAGLLAGLHRAGLLGGGNRSALAGLPVPSLRGLLAEAAAVAALTCARAGALGPTAAEVAAWSGAASG